MSRRKGQKDTTPRRTAARKQAEIAASQGLTPLQMMLMTAQYAWDLAEKMKSASRATEDVLAMRRIASEEAARAAPYIHAKLASEVHRVINDDSQRSEEDIERELADIERRRAAAGTPKGTVEAPVSEEPPGMVH